MAFDIRDEDEQHDEFDEYEEVKQPARPKFYRRRKFWIFCIPNAIIALIVAVILALYVIMPKIAQGLMNKATIDFSQIDITNPSPTSMDIVMAGEMRHTGPFHAEISFPGTVTVSWNGTTLGTTEIPGTSTASGGSGSLNLASSFAVSDPMAFAAFSSYMLNAETFVWHLQGKLNVKALGHTVKDLELNKDITVNAFNGLSGVTIQKFSLPGDAPNGQGIIVEIDTVVSNPSAIQMYMGSLTLAISYKNTVMGYVTSSNLTMVRGPQTLSMKGVLIPQNTTEGLADTSEMMSRYIGNVVTDTIATGFDVKPDGVNELAWLSAAVKNLKLTVPLQSPQPLQLIKSLNLGALGLVFTPPTAYNPITTSTGVLANYSLPDGFGFKIQFTQVANTFALSRNNVTIANLNSSYNPSTSDMAAGTLNFNLLATPLIVPDASHEAFQEFNRDLTIGSTLPFNVVGQASVFANTSIGTVNLVNIPFNASTELGGLQSLANPAPTITSLQVVSGTTSELTMAITVVIVNPSSISLNAGDIVLNLVYSGVTLGTVTMPNLAIVPGANTINATSSIDPAASPQGLELLNLYTSGTGAAVSIVGTPTSTTVDSLTLAFGALNIGSQMPGLQAKLLAGASLLVLDTTLVNGLAQTVVTVNNPFVPPMTIVSIDSQITYNGVSLGTVVSTFPSPPVIPGLGQGTITANLAMNTNPDDLTALIRAQAIKNGINIDAFDGLLSLKNGGNPPSSLFNGFNVADFVVKAMAGLVVDITMTTTVKLGDYQVTMPYTQTGVPTATDQSILRLIPLVGTPIAQILVGRSALAFDSIKILAPGETSFQTDIIGAITDTGPLDAQIQFPNPVTISYKGQAIGSMPMPTVNAVANQGAALNLAGVPFTVTDLAAFTDFNVFAVNNAKFNWTISATGLIVNAMGVALPGVTMTKTVTLDGFNKLAGLQLGNYSITAIDSAGMHMLISASIANPSTIGMTIPVSQFNTIFQGKVLGPAVANGLTLVPHGTSSFALQATIATGNGDLKPYLTGIFQNALSDTPTDLDAQGTGAPGVSWLDAAIKSLLLHTALPPLSAPPIESVQINSMSMDFACQGCDWAPLAVSSITAKTNLPFAFTVPIVQLSQNVEILDKNGQVVGTLNTPYAPATASGSFVTTTTNSSSLTIPDGSHEIYENFIGDLNEATTYEMGLRGTTDSILDLGELGHIEVKGIKLDVKSSLNGLQGLKKLEFYSEISFIVAADQTVVALVQITNPSNLTLHIGDLTLSAGANYTSEGYIGYSTISDLTLAPGINTVIAKTVELTGTLPAAQAFAASLTSNPAGTEMYLYANPTSSSNPALAAGLKNLQTSVLVPFFFITPAVPALPYDNVWKVSVPPTVVNDGLVDMTATFNNPLFGAPIHFVQPNTNFTLFSNWVLPSTLSLALPNLANTIFFGFLNNFQYSLTGNQSVTLTFKMQVVIPSFARPILMLALNASQSLAGSLNCYLQLTPEITAGSDPMLMSPDWTTGGLFSSMPIPENVLQVGPDFALLLNWFDKTYPNTTVTPSPTASAGPTSLASLVPTTATPPPVTPTVTTPSDAPPTLQPSTVAIPTPTPTTVAPATGPATTAAPAPTSAAP